MTDQMDKKTVTATYCTTDECKELKAIREICNQYTDDPSYVYKYCTGHLVVMQKTKNTLTNESRSDVVDPMHAKYRASELMVVRIIKIDQMDPNVQMIKSHYRSGTTSTSTSYQVGEVVHPDSFDQNLDRVCSNGIHYFKSVESAFYYMNHNHFHNLTGQWIDWDCDGLLLEKQSYYAGSKSGRWTKYDMGNLIEDTMYNNDENNGAHKQYYQDGTLKIHANYLDDKLDGQYLEYYDDHTLKLSANYRNGLRHGDWIMRHLDGKIREESQYKDGSKNGKSTKYYPNGKPRIECQYVGGMMNGPYTKYYENGVPCEVGYYTNDQINGLYKEYYENGMPCVVCGFSFGRLNGSYKSYLRNGQLHNECNYKNGILDHTPNQQSDHLIGNPNGNLTSFGDQLFPIICMVAVGFVWGIVLNWLMR
jgi:antitoxin component YwqK of YwqJK toxin-antitoxin module